MGIARNSRNYDLGLAFAVVPGIVARQDCEDDVADDESRWPGHQRRKVAVLV